MAEPPPLFGVSAWAPPTKSVQRLQHGQLAYAAEGLAVASHFVRHSDEPRFLAAPSDLGITVPQVAERGTPVVTGVDAGTHNQHDQIHMASVAETSDGRMYACAETNDEDIT